jgi:outer membrane lipoprotein SlyB
VLPGPAPAVVVAAPSAGGQATGSAAPSVVTESGLIVSQPAPVKPICSNCGTVVAVTPIQKQGSGSGAGAVAGGAVGAVLGNQIGKGGGRTVATILGAIGGGVAGNMIEKNVRKETVYRVQVRMEDGSTRTVEQASLPTVGSKVTVDAGVLHSADSSWPTPGRSRPLPQVQATPGYDRVAL